MKILPAQLQDAPVLSDMFFAHLDADPSYISHGEMQMGVGTGRFSGRERTAWGCRSSAPRAERTA